MKKSVFLFCTMFVLLGGSCSNHQADENNDLSYIVWDSLENKDFLTEPYTSVDFVKLETNENCILNDVAKIEIDDSLVFIEDYMQRLYLFNKQGAFLCKIGTKGGAENEYVTLFDFVLDRDKKQLYIVDSAKGKILVYDYYGKFIEKKDIELTSLSNSIKVAFIDDNHLATINFNSPEERTNFSILDIKSQSVSDYIEYISIGNIRSHNDVGRTTYHSSNLLLCAELSDTIYTSENGKIRPKYVFNSFARHATKDDIEEGKYDFGAQPASELLSKGISAGIKNLYSTDQFLYFQYRTKEGYYRIFFNTEKSKGYKFDITNNLDADNSALWNYLKSSSKDAFVCALPVGEFLSKESVRNSYMELNNLLSHSTEEDNPILAFFNVIE